MLGLIILFWIIVPICAAIVAGNKGRSGAGWFFITLLLSPAAILILLALPALSAEPAARNGWSSDRWERLGSERPPIAGTADTKVCPQCARRSRPRRRFAASAVMSFRPSRPPTSRCLR
jgi:hypothetical protein